MGHGGGIGGGGNEIELGLHITSHEEASGSLEGLHENLKKLGEGLLDVGKIAAGFALGGLFQQLGAGIGGAIEEGLGSMKELGAATLELSRQTGSSAEQASGLLAVFGRFGVSADQASTSLGIFSKHLAGIADVGDSLLPISKSFTKQIDDLGISMKDASGAALPMNDVLLEVADKFKEMPDGVDKTALSMALFGRSGKDLIPILDLGKEGMQEAMDTAKKYGLTLTGDNLNAIKSFGLAQKDLTEAGEGLRLQIGVALLPILAQLVTVAVGLAQSFNTLVLPAIKGFGTMILAAVQPPLDWLSGALGTVGTIIGQFLQYLDPANKVDVMAAWFGPNISFQIDEVVRGVKGLVGAIGTAIGDVASVLSGQKSIGDALQDVFAIGSAEGGLLGALGNLGLKLGATLISAAGDLAGQVTRWLAAQWAQIDWGAVWAAVKGVAFDVARFLGNVGQQVTTFLAAEWATINWALVWSTVKSSAFDIGRYVVGLNVQISAWLAAEWAQINWAAVWGQAKGLGAGIGAALASIDVGGIATGLGAAIAGAVGTIDWGKLLAGGAALVAGWLAAVQGMDWNSVGTMIADLLVDAIVLVIDADVAIGKLAIALRDTIANAIKTMTWSDVQAALTDILGLVFLPAVIVAYLAPILGRIVSGIAAGFVAELTSANVLGKLEAAGEGLMNAIAQGIRSISLPIPHIDIGSETRDILGQSISVPTISVGYTPTTVGSLTGSRAINAAALGGGQGARAAAGGGGGGQTVTLHFTQAAPIYGHANLDDAILQSLVTLQRSGKLKVALV